MDMAVKEEATSSLALNNSISPYENYPTIAKRIPIVQNPGQPHSPSFRVFSVTWYHSCRG